MSLDSLKTPVSKALIETIVAEATPYGRAGISVVRLSGPDALNIAETIVGNLPEPRKAYYRQLKDANRHIFDEGLAIWFKAPSSFTGEEVVEIHGHGGPVVVNVLKQTCVSLGARLARPGEFSERAFTNNKLDLVQLEAIADLIDSASEQAARNAFQSLSGVFSQAVHDIVAGVTELRIYVEAAIDFPEEEVDFLAEPFVAKRIGELKAELADLTQQAEQGRRLQTGLQLGLLGPPNVGKSSILNRLSGQSSAIVTEIPGTTRDVIREQVLIDGIPVTIADTAGIRSAEDPIEKLGIARSWNVAQSVDLCLWVFDTTTLAEFASDEQALDAKLEQVTLANGATGLQTAPSLIVLNKSDALMPEQRLAFENFASDRAGVVLVSAITGDGWTHFIAAIKRSTGTLDLGESVFSARARHVVALQEAEQRLLLAGSLAEEGHPGELIAEELKFVQSALGEITGRVTSDELLGKIFGSFCIGK